MVENTLGPLGPLFGPNFHTVVQNDETGREISLQIYQDANNDMLKANGLRTHYYFVPQRVYLAKKQHAPADFDFGMTVFKGLMTTENTVGVTDDQTTNGEASVGGSFCTFATTFAVPESVIRGAIQKLRQLDNFGPDQPDPELGMVSITENNVTVEVPNLVAVGSEKVPLIVNTQGNGKGSLESSGISAFLVTCNQFAAGAIAGSLRRGKSPFMVHYNLKKSFYINACQVVVIVDADKTFEQFSAAISAGGFLGLDSISLGAAYQNTVTNGGITTEITMNGAAVDADMKKLIDTQVDDMRKLALDMVKNVIFDFKPSSDTAASADRGLFSSVFGGSAVSMKANYQRSAVKFTQILKLNGTITTFEAISGTLNDLEPAIVANVDKYLAVVDIGESFKKLQVAATSNVNWDETTPNGIKLNDPIQSMQIEVGYPDFSNPTANGVANPQFRAQGFHYITGKKVAERPSELSVWNDKANGKEIINVSFLKLDQELPDWKPDEVIIRKTIVYDPTDPRVELSNGGSTFVTEIRTKSHTPVMTPDEVGYVAAKFLLPRAIPNEAISMMLTCKIGSRTDTLEINAKNQKDIIWEIFSDKYKDHTSFTYEVEVTVVGPNFTDDEIVFKSPAPVTVELPTGRVKNLGGIKLQIPNEPEDQVDTINKYIKTFATQPA
jgi:hypothetical protein